MVQTNHTNAYETTLRVDMGPTDLTAAVQSTDGSPASPCYLVMEPGNADRREYILFDGTFTADQFVTSTINNRYLSPGSSATSGITHPAGSIVRFSPVAQHFTDHFTDTSPHSATSAATGNRLVVRDANARFQAASPSIDADVAVKSYVDAGDVLDDTGWTTIDLLNGWTNWGTGFAAARWRRVDKTVVVEAFLDGSAATNEQWGLLPAEARPSAHLPYMAGFKADGDQVCRTDVLSTGVLRIFNRGTSWHGFHRTYFIT